VGTTENVGTAKAEIIAPAPADGDIAHVSIEHGEGGRGMVDKELKQLLALPEISLGSLSPGNVLDGAAHQDGFAIRITFNPAPAMNPASGAIIVADDSVLVVKKPTASEHLFGKIGGHHGVVVGVNEGDPALNGAFVIGSDSENFIKDIGGSPDPGLQIERVAAQTGYALRLLKRARQVTEGAVGLRFVARLVHRFPGPDLGVAAAC
jgi:hypothetical protein